MRLKHVKNADLIMKMGKYYIDDAGNYKGRWLEVFGNSNPIYIEIGTGKGDYLIQMAILNPSINFIGIEKYDSVIVKGLKKIEDNLDNLVFLRADALDIDDIFDHEIDRIYLNFSDPWPKNRHHFRRLSSNVFLEKYESVFKGEKIIEMRTDNQDLFSYSLVSFSGSGYTLKKISFDLHKDDMPLITTEYEDKFSNDNKPIYYVLCCKSYVNNM